MTSRRCRASGVKGEALCDPCTASRLPPQRPTSRVSQGGAHRPRPPHLQEGPQASSGPSVFQSHLLCPSCMLPPAGVQSPPLTRLPAPLAPQEIQNNIPPGQAGALLGRVCSVYTAQPLAPFGANRRSLMNVYCYVSGRGNNRTQPLTHHLLLGGPPTCLAACQRWEQTGTRVGHRTVPPGAGCSRRIIVHSR